LARWPGGEQVDDADGFPARVIARVVMGGDQREPVAAAEQPGGVCGEADRVDVNHVVRHG
jgi:hypothetical protein